MLMPRTRTGVSSQPKVMKLKTARTAMRTNVRRGWRPMAMSLRIGTGQQYTAAVRGWRVRDSRFAAFLIHIKRATARRRTADCGLRIPLLPIARQAVPRIRDAAGAAVLVSVGGAHDTPQIEERLGDELLFPFLVRQPRVADQAPGRGAPLLHTA